MYRFLIFVLLMLAWLVFSGMFDAFHLGLGLLSAGFVTWISSDMLFAHRDRPMRARAAEAMRAPSYMAWLLWQIFLASIDVLKLALSPLGSREVAPRIVRYRSTLLKTDYEKFVFAQSITLAPGTVTIRVEGDEFLVHAISEAAAAGLDGAMERRIAEVYGSIDPVAGGGDL
jgi:multicomponent Na+:H+ antiporter subunit E